MKPSKHKIAFKVLIGYFILGILATISGFLVLSEIKTFTLLQRQDISDRSNIIKTGSLIANIYENESLARAAIQLNSAKKFNEYVKANEALLLKIDSLNLMVGSVSQANILDSIKLIINKKLTNITDLKNLKHKDNSDTSINKAINKLSSIDSLLGKITIEDLVDDPSALDKETHEKFEEYVRILNKYNPQDPINSIGQKQIDSLISISRNMLKDAQRKTSSQRRSMQIKERELIENDLTISRKLQELLNTLERDVIRYANNINKQREETINHSRNIILFGAGISFIIIIMFSIITLNDFWKSQRYRKQLENANKITSSLLKSREQLISMVSHDLRAPLSTITGYGELLQKSTHSTKEGYYVEHIRNASAYMGQLVDDLLIFSKLENGKIAIEPIPFELEKHIDEIIQNVKSLVQEKPITFLVEHDVSIDRPIISDPFRLKQILYNLVINAYKFTSTGTITITSVLKQNSKHQLLISVSDTGIGISKDKQESIFKAFTQVDHKDNKHNGFGLGLTISKKLTELLGGTLMLESELGKGSTFTLNIPITFSNKPLNTFQTFSTKTNFNLKAIVVEDDESMQYLIKDLLKQYGTDVILFKDAQSALKTIDSLTYDFVLTDIQLPKMNGIHFMEMLKKHGSYDYQPIIAMTGRANLAVEDYIDSGFSGVLIKPFHPNELYNLLEQLFGAHLIKTKTPAAATLNKKTEGFNIASLSPFLNHDNHAIHKTLQTFLKSTKKHSIVLKQAKIKNDIETINHICHKMQSMVRQLDVKTLIPFLDVFETSKIIDEATFIAFEKTLDDFIKALEGYLN